MNLPVNVEDLSLLDHAPLRDHIAVHKLTEGRRLLAKDSVSRFVEEVQQDGKAAAAAKEWACLAFSDDFPDENTFEVTDGGEELYKVFFEYQRQLHQGRQDNNFDPARQYLAHVVRNGISAIKAVKLEDHRAKTRPSARGRGNGSGSKRDANHCSSHSFDSKTVLPQAETGIHPDTGDRATGSGRRCRPHSTMHDSAIQHGSESSPAIAQRPTLSGTTKSSKRSTSNRKKKRKASCQNPPVVTPSDASEDDKGQSKTHAVTAAGSISHRQKRVASNPAGQSRDLIGVGNQVDRAKPVPRAEEKKQHYKHTTIIPQCQSPLMGFPLNGFVPRSGVKGRRSAGLPPSGRRHNRPKLLNDPARPFQLRRGPKGPRKIRSFRDPQPSANKRMRRALVSTPDKDAEEGPDAAHDLRARLLPESTIKGSPVTGSQSTRGNIQSKATSKRTRLDFEIAFMAPDKNASADSCEFLGPDVRSLRPLPKKTHDVRLVSAVRGVPHGAPSLEHVDQLLRDAASNELAILHERVGPDIPDWTQDEEHDAECDDLQDDDQDEVSNVQDTAAASVPPKPPVPAPPHIWAQSRQEVCESFEYFRCYHSGVYSKDDIVKGYLLGAHSASRDIFHHGGKLIISHGGGKSESILDPRRGPKRFQTDQDQEASDRSVRALLKTWKDRRPIVLLADDKYALFPFDLTSAKYTYVVLGVYWISHAWAECQSARDGSGRIVRWKFAFQWCESQGDPWWLSRLEMIDTTPYPSKSISSSGTCPTNRSSDPASTDGDANIQCKHCQEHSPFVYKQGWMCLNPRCNSFWSINSEEPKQLDYREEFLNLLPHEFGRLPNITPSRVTATPDGVTTTYAFSKGLHCTNCGRLSCRYKWEHWECSNCNFKHIVTGRVRSPKEFWHQRPSKGFLHSQIGKDSGILPCRLEPINLGACKGFTNRLTFILPHDRGKIHLILGAPLSNGDADDIFQLYQQQASTGELKLRRYPLRNHRARGLLLTNYFSQNSGEPYQYVGGSGQTVPFCEAPGCVRRALALIKERANLALGTDVPFNEILSAAYMERQKMSFHSDSEKGLGPIVASLSLGSAALMHFRPHVNVENPTGKCPYALTLVLRHGDVLIMEGEGVQKYYEHTVVPMNFRIAATARCIGSA